MVLPENTPKYCTALNDDGTPCTKPVRPLKPPVPPGLVSYYCDEHPRLRSR